MNPTVTTDHGRSESYVHSSMCRTAMTRVRDPEQTRSAILQATIDALAQVGYAGTTTVEVQKRAGVSRGALLHHYGSRAELLGAAVQEIGARRHAEMVDSNARLAARVVLLDEALVMLRRSFSSVTYRVEQELWAAARTDGELRRSMQPVEQRLGRQMKSGLDRLFEVVPEADRFAVIQLAVTFVRGLVAADSLRTRIRSGDVDLQTFSALLSERYIASEPTQPNDRTARRRS
jgi:AcrR family transcriptional regulator